MGGASIPASTLREGHSLGVGGSRFREILNLSYRAGLECRDWLEPDLSTQHFCSTFSVRDLKGENGKMIAVVAKYVGPMKYGQTFH